MGKNKLKKFSELSTFPFVYQNFDQSQVELTDYEGKAMNTKGTWQEIFGNKKPIVLELACGGGEYTVGLAKRYPDRNFIGIDIKGARMWKGAKIVHEEKIPNVAFLRIRIELIERYFEKGEASEIWITFPDPHLKESKILKRLTSPRFLAIYQKILEKGNIVQLKTDDPTLYEYTVETATESDIVTLLEHHNDIYSLPELPVPELDIKTYYERMHLQNKKLIKYVKMKLS